MAVVGSEDSTAVTTVRRDWAGDEAAEPGGWAETRRLLRRGRRRWLRTLAWALVVAAAAAVVAARLPRLYTTRVVLHVDGGTVIAGEVGRAVLSDAQLGAVIAKQRLYGALGRSRAIARLRANLDVTVDGDALAIAYRGDDAARVYAVAHDLGALVADEQGWRWVDAGRVDAVMDRSTRLALVGAIVFILALPLCAIGVGAWDGRVYDLDDVRRLGLPTVGAVRRFDGDDTGALDARRARDPRARLGPS